LSTANPTWPNRARTRAAAVGSQPLTAWAMTRPPGNLPLHLVLSPFRVHKVTEIYG
jgi:hypothetical protein